jgi:hypothetical protein|tara:strand:+ start:604 stop:873 length:270 start_codon:yes stop_codon:yes gene_type:complete
MAATLNRILAKVDSLGDEYFVLHSEIKPYGPGTRRFMLGRHRKIPKQIQKLPNGKFSRDLGEQTYMHRTPLPALQFEEWLDEFISEVKK